ncbi:MAG: recombinase family protein [Ruminiclostridium sp.]|nr:recombinase family protein [Ruminiclostridium sp.]
MARKSRASAIAMDDAPVQAPEKVYSTGIYARLSVEDNNHKEDGDSIEMQKYMLQKYVNEQPDMRIYSLYCDNGRTGTNFERPEFERLMDDVRAGKVNCIVVKDLSRLGRNYIETGNYMEKIFPFLGVRFIAVNDGYDSLNSQNTNDITVSLKNLINDIYAKDISKKSGSALAVKQRNGEFIGAYPPYGYLKDKDDNHRLVLDPDTAHIVRQIFLWKAKGIGINIIARRLNEMGVPSPAKYRYLSGVFKKEPTGSGAIWQGQSIKLITSNLMYAGHMAQGKSRKSLYDGQPTTMIPQSDWVVVRDTHEPIIDEDTFYKVQKIKEEQNRLHVSLNGKYADISNKENVFKGLLRCEDCKTKMVRYKDVSKAGSVCYRFICRVYAQNLSMTCTNKSVREDNLFECVYTTLQSQIDLAVDMERILERLNRQEHFQTARKKVEEKISTTRQKLKRIVFLKGSLFESYTNHLLSEDEYLYSKKSYDEDIGRLQIELAALERESIKYEKTLSPQNEWIKAFQKYKGKTSITREMTLELIQCIWVSGYNTIEIVWNYGDEYKKILPYKEGGACNG